jgi:hypothetical protein
MIFVSGDDSEASFYKYWSQMSCGAIPYDEHEARDCLEGRLEISSYPTLLMLGPRQDEGSLMKGDRVVINTEVRAVIENGDYITDFPFYPKRWGDLCSKYIPYMPCERNEFVIILTQLDIAFYCLA